ncbi:MAG: inositol monophosphatase [Acidimicrobiales bacterium]|nr:inositol monophosphatase [Acidimicrobiales bacterium]
MGEIVDSDHVLADLHAAADAVAAALDGHADWGPSGNRPDQYASDVVADEAVRGVLLPLGYGLLSEESAVVEAGEGCPMVVVDPLDGSTNASRGIPHYAASLCAVDDEGPLAAVVLNLALGTRYEAVRGGGARRDGVGLFRDDSPQLSEAIVGVSGLPASNPGWAQFRCMGAAALDLCAVADGTLDAYVDCVVDAHGVWDYLGALLVCREAGVTVEDAKGRDLCVLDRAIRRTPVAAAGTALHEALLGRD